MIEPNFFYFIYDKTDGTVVTQGATKVRAYTKLSVARRIATQLMRGDDINYAGHPCNGHDLVVCESIQCLEINPNYKERS